MDKDTGWIKSYRSLLDWEWWDDFNVTRLWITILHSVNHDQKSWKGHVIEAGQMITSLASLSEKSGLSIQEIRTALNKLKSTGEITSEATNKNTLITVVKWADFQSDERTTNTQSNTQVNNQATSDQQTINKQSTTNKNDKNEKNDKNIDYLSVIRLFHETCPSFPQVRSVSESRKKAIKARLNKYSLDDLRTVFEKAEASDFLKGNNRNNWSANFDWLIKDSNIPKVLEGNYDNRSNDKRPTGTDWDFTDFI